MKEAGRLRKELKRIKRRYTHYMASEEIEDRGSGREHYLFNCSRMDLRRAKEMYNELKKAIRSKRSLARFGSYTRYFMPFE